MKRLVTAGVAFLLVCSGCTYVQKARRTDELEVENEGLRRKIALLRQEQKSQVSRVVEEKERELSELERAKAQLEASLQKEIGEYKAKLQMTERGLVITFLSEVFFDSGRAELRADGKGALSKVAQVLNEKVPGSNVAVEGHTDNEPIRYSGWKSNWELSVGRSLAVLHFLVDECAVKPERLSANGYGQFRPVSDNETAQGKQKNRRVEIVILPAQLSKVKTP